MPTSIAPVTTLVFEVWREVQGEYKPFLTKLTRERALDFAAFYDATNPEHYVAVKTRQVLTFTEISASNDVEEAQQERIHAFARTTA